MKTINSKNDTYCKYKNSIDFFFNNRFSLSYHKGCKPQPKIIHPNVGQEYYGYSL